MKTKVTILASAAVALAVLPVGVFGQETTPRRDADPLSQSQKRDDISGERTGTTAADRAYQLGPVQKGTDVLGMRVRNSQNENIGEVEELAIDLSGGRVAQAIVSIGGFLGVGEKRIAIPPSALQYDSSQNLFRLDGTKDRLQQAPAVELSRWDEAMGRDRVAESYRYFEADPNLAAKDKRLSAPAAGTDEFPRLDRASKLIGMKVNNLQGEKVGDIKDLSVNVSAGRVVQVILSVGGFLGIGDELTAVPPAALRFNPEREVLLIDLNKDSLSQAPRFKANAWPDFNDPNYVNQVYRVYKVEPYFDVDQAKRPASSAADNTRRNVRDRSGNTLTPLDQGNSQADINVTADIRKRLMDRDDFSVLAQNIKVITSGGKVTLRGPVNTAAEKRAIGEIAAQIAGKERVDNQLEIKGSATRE